MKCTNIQYTEIFFCPVCPSAAPVASALSARYSHRSVVIMGGLICSLGVVLGAFARNLIELYLTVGFLNGEWFEVNTHKQHKLQNTHTKHDYHWSPLLQVLAMH